MNFNQQQKIFYLLMLEVRKIVIDKYKYGT